MPIPPQESTERPTANFGKEQFVCTACILIPNIDDMHVSIGKCTYCVRIEFCDYMECTSVIVPVNLGVDVMYV